MTKAEELVCLLKEKKYHVSTAESCTGGMIAAAIVDISGASDVFEEGFVTYSNAAKEKNLGVSAETIENDTVVSAPVAEEMAAGVAQRTKTDLAISVTGYAGPDNAEDGTPAGTVYIGIYYRGKAKGFHFKFDGNRNQVRSEATEEAISLALATLKEEI